MTKQPTDSARIDDAGVGLSECVANALLKTALSGADLAYQVWLQHRDPERWKDKRTIAGEQPIDWESELTRIATETGIDRENVRRELDEIRRRRRRRVVD